METKINEKKIRVSDKVIYPELSYTLTGILFEVHKELGSYGREKQYGDLIQEKFDQKHISYKRELQVGNTGNILDFIIENKIILEIKSTKIITREYYRQLQNYLQQTNVKLGLLVNFREKFLKPLRVLKIDPEKFS